MGVVLAYRIRVLGGGLQVDLSGQVVAPTAPREVGALVVLALNAGRELALESLKVALFDGDPVLVSKSAVQTPVSRLRKAGLPIPPGRYVLEMEPSDVDIVDVDLRARDFIEAAAASKRLSEKVAAALVEVGAELHGLWRHDPADAVGHDPVQSKLFEPQRRRHRRFGMAFVRLLGAVGETGRALEVLDEYVDRYGEDDRSLALRDGLLEVPTPALQVSAPVAPTVAADGPIQVGRPPRQARAFQQRQGLAAEITAGMSEGSAVLTQVVAAGGGGVGKTQLAASVFSRARDEGVELLVWVDASSRESIVTTYAQARGEIESGVVSGGSAEEGATAFLSWLGSAKLSWLVVLDDVTDPADVRGLWPEGTSGRVVATTRRRDLAPAGTKQVLVGVFTPGEVQGYLEERLAGSPAELPHPEVLEEAVELAEDLGRLPVAVAQAAAVILNEGITCAEYRRRFADQAASIDRLFPSDAGADEYAHTVATTWHLAIEQADRLPPVGLAGPALHLAAVVDANGAPDTLWFSTPVLQYLGEQVGGPGHLVPAEDARTALRNLHRLSLLKHDPAGGAFSVHTHGLVQRATLEPLTVDQGARVVRAAADALARIWPSAENDPEMSRSLRQNTATLARQMPEVMWRPEAHEALFRAGRSLGELGLIHDAIAYWTEMEVTANQLLGADHPQTLTVRHDLADARGVAGDTAGAVRAFEDLLEDCLRVLGPDHPSTLSVRNDLADWRGAAGNAEGAAQALEELLAHRSQILGPDHPDTLTTRHDLTYWRGSTGDAAAAVAGFGELLVDRLRVLGPRHRDTLFTRYRLANWRGSAGDAESAAAAFEELAGDVLEVLGPDHPHTLFTRHDLARWRGVAGNATAAVDMLASLLEDQLEALGPEHPDTLTTRQSLAHWRGVAGDVSAAAEGLGELLADRLRVLGPDDRRTFYARHDLADWTGLAGHVAAAVEMLAELLEDQRKLLGPEHLHTLATRHNLAYWRGVAGDVSAAVEGLEELLADRLRLLGANHAHTLAARRDLAYWRAGGGDPPGGAAEPHTHPPDLLPLCDWRCGGRGPRVRRPVRWPSVWTTTPSLPESLSTPPDVRLAARHGTLVTQTSGAAPGYVQANLVAVPESAADDFAEFVARNPRACPLVEVVRPGESPLSAPGAKLWSDVPRYRVFERGTAPAEALDVGDRWRPDLVAFLLGCSFTFDHLLVEAGLPVRHVEDGTNVPMFVTNRPCEAAGRFSGPLVVSMRPFPPDLVEQVAALTARYPHVHGAPVNVGDPNELGISSVSAPDFGEPAEVRPGEVPVFWACGVTPQLAVEGAGLDLVVTHAPGHMFVTDLALSDLASLELPLRTYAG